MMKREDGYYWIKQYEDSPWAIGMYMDPYWYFIGTSDYNKEVYAVSEQQIPLPDEDQYILLTATINPPYKSDPEYCGWVNEVKGCIAQEQTLEKCKESLLKLYWIKKSVEHKLKDGSDCECIYTGLDKTILPLPLPMPDENEKCKHEWIDFVDRIDRTRNVWCWKCGKDYKGVYNNKI